MRYRKTNRTRRPDILGQDSRRQLKPRYNKQAMSWHERLDRQMMEAIERDKDKTR